MNTLEKGSVILFQGDSVTDCGRDRISPDGLGRGYAFIISALLAAEYPGLFLKFHNRGISGNRTSDLLSRWKEDCIDLRPDIVSILIGINNTWRRYDSDDPTPVETFEREYRALLTMTRDALDPLFVICEPFVLPVPEDRRKWREDLDPKIAVTRALAAEFSALYIPFDGIFAAASTRTDPAYWAPDGVHPSEAGHGLMAREWIDRVTGA